MSLIDPLQNNTTPWGDMMMDEDEVLTAMKGERMSLTCAQEARTTLVWRS